MKRIEFIGGSGIGKTTLFQEAVKNRDRRDAWMTAEEARIHLAKTITVDGPGLRLLQSYLKTDMMMIKRLTGYAAAKILHRRSREIFDSIHEKYVDVGDAFWASLNGYGEINSVRKILFTAYFHNLLLFDIMVFDYHGLDRVVVTDEGIIHNNPGFGDEESFQAIYANHAGNSSSVIPIAIIYCHMNEKGYMERRRDKIRQGRGTAMERTLNDEQLATACRNALRLSENKLHILKKYGIPVLEINMDNPVRENAKSVYEFINDLSRRRFV